VTPTASNSGDVPAAPPPVSGSAAAKIGGGGGEAGTNYGHIFVGVCGAAGLVIGTIAGYTVYARGGGVVGSGTAATPERVDVAAFANPVYGI